MKVGKGKAKAKLNKRFKVKRFKEIVWEQALPVAIHESRGRRSKDIESKKDLKRQDFKPKNKVEPGLKKTWAFL